MFTVIPVASAVQPGWAEGGNPKNPTSQYAFDAARGATAAECGPNAIVLFRVRGSGEPVGDDRLGFWTYVAGTKLIKQGWRVRDLQARYPAPSVPVTKALAHLAFGDLPGLYLTVRAYRNVASAHWPAVRSDLIKVARRCPARRIAIAGYSQGAIVLRYVLPRLPADVERQIVSIDLVADPTADASVDGAMTVRTGDSDSRRTERGIDTFGARGPNPWFHQTPYPVVLAKRTVVYCMRNDNVCDARPATVTSPNNWLNVVRIHTGYSWGAIGAAAGMRIGPAPAPAITYPVSTSTAPTGTSPGPAPAPSRRVITVDNRVTNGMGMREDATPVRLTTQPWIRCTSRGCNIAGTERSSGGTFDAAVCQRFGERTTNGDDTSAADDANPLRFESTRYYGVRLANGTFGYVSEVWINAAHRGGLGLPAC